MAEPSAEPVGTTHTYVARAWYRDTSTLFMLGSFLWFLVQDQANVELFVPHQYHDAVAKLVVAVSLFLRWKSATRPIALSAGVTREVNSIPPKPSVTGARPFLPIVLLAAALSLSALGLPACSNNPPPATGPTANLSATGLRDYHLTRVVKALDLVRDIATTAEEQHPKLMSTNSTRKVVLYHQSVVKTIAAVPEGWVAVAEQGLTELQAQIPSEEWKQIDPYVRLLLTLYKETR